MSSRTANVRLLLAWILGLGLLYGGLRFTPISNAVLIVQFAALVLFLSLPR
jgi:hypothetical protein